VPREKFYSRGTSLFKGEEVSRKDAKAQRRARKEQKAFNTLAVFLRATSAFAGNRLFLFQITEHLR
jgi:hypothetical protein